MRTELTVFGILLIGERFFLAPADERQISRRGDEAPYVKLENDIPLYNKEGILCTKYEPHGLARMIENEDTVAFAHSMPVIRVFP